MICRVVFSNSINKWCICTSSYYILYHQVVTTAIVYHTKSIKIATILQMTFQSHFLVSRFFYFDNMPLLVATMALPIMGDKPLSERIMAYFIGVYVRHHSASMSYDWVMIKCYQPWDSHFSDAVWRRPNAMISYFGVWQMWQIHAL